MIAHAIRMIWRRRGANFLLVIEIAVCFLVVLGIAASALQMKHNWSRPLGFERADRWAVNMVSDDGNERMGELGPKLEAMRSAVEALPQVEAAAYILHPPYEASTWVSIWEADGRRVRAEMLYADDRLLEVAGFELLEGRWFGAEDVLPDERPVIIDETLAARYWPDQSPIGAIIDSGEPLRRVIGVVASVRRHGELSKPEGLAFERFDFAQEEQIAPRWMMLETAPGAAGVEAAVATALRATAAQLSYDPRSLEALRTVRLRFGLVPLAIAGVVAVFMMLMVALGLTGVLWLSVTKRRSEIGVRRAQGATRRDILLAVIGEMVVLAVIGCGLGSVVAGHVVAFELIPLIEPSVWIAGMAAAAVTILSMVVFSAAMPARQAAWMDPAMALRHE